MNQLKGACVLAQSGGPTAVINASAQGIIEAALASDCITKVYGAAHGIKGVIDDKLYDLTEELPQEIALLQYTPSSVLGSCRYMLKNPEEDDSEAKRILEIFKKYDIRYFFYNGGNDSMDTCNKISKYMLKCGYDCRIIGVPKTIDNDLCVTDHCPGYGSAAKYIATSAMEVWQDAHVYDTGLITIIEIMGRHAGWLAGAAGIATWAGFGPDLLYLPEVDFDVDKFLEDVAAIYKTQGKCMIAVSEGIHDKDGRFIAEYGSTQEEMDAFGHVQLGGLASVLSNIIKRHLKGAKVRGIELSLLQRCASHIASATDIEESKMAGRVAVESAVSGITDKMVAFSCQRSDGYVCQPKLVELTAVANNEKKVPREWINAAGNGIEQAFVDYALPLIQGTPATPLEAGLPRFAKLKKKLTTE